MKLIDRFLEYVKIPTMSDESSETSPSSEKQLVLADILAEELRELGLTNVERDVYGYVYATLPANIEANAPVVGFIAHMDTSDAASDTGIRPAVIEYNGGDICLNRERNIFMTVEAYPYLDGFKGQHLIVTDGTTLLGADDKAGIAEIMSMLEYLVTENTPHGTVRIAFTPDEEVGRGTEHFDLEKFGADYAYTVDGGFLGELEYENFNAASAKITVHGVSIHPGSAKDKMINALRVAMEFNSMLPEDQIPERTEGYEGFFHPVGIKGDIESCELAYIIRDHDRGKFEAKKALISEIAQKLNDKYGKGTVDAAVKDSYYNMKEIIDSHIYTVERAEAAMLECGVEPKVSPIRGGTDGAMLSFMGLPCPNLCTGGANYHSRFEFASVEAMQKCCEILIAIISDAVKFTK